MDNTSSISSRDKLLKRNIWIIYLFNFFKGLMFFLPIYSLYLQRELFTATNVALIISVAAIARIIFEVPAGAIADLFGRKKTLLLSAFIAIAAIIFLGIGGSLLIFIVFALLNALSDALVSGTDTAILFDTLKNLKRVVSFQKIVSWDIGTWQIGAAVSALIGGFLAAQNFRLPIFLTVVTFTIAFLIAFFIVEPKYVKVRHRNVIRQMNDSLRIIYDNKNLLMIFFVSILFMAFSEVVHQFNAIIFDFKGIPIVYFGVISAATFLCAFLSSLWSSHYLNKKYTEKAVLIVSAVLWPVFLFVAAMSTGIWTAIFIVLGSFVWGVRLPIITDLFNKHVTSSKRVTVLSIGNLTTILGIAIYSPIFGWIIDLYSMNTAMIITSILSLSAIIFLLKIKV